MLSRNERSRLLATKPKFSRGTHRGAQGKRDASLRCERKLTSLREHEVWPQHLIPVVALRGPELSIRNNSPAEVQLVWKKKKH